MAYETKPNTGTLFVNQKTNERQPDHSGNLLIDPSLIPAIQAGKRLRIAAWNKKTQGGDNILSLAVSEAHESRPSSNDGAPF